MCVGYQKWHSRLNTHAQYQQRDLRCHHSDFRMAFIDHMLQLEHSIWIHSFPLLVFRPGEHSLRMVQDFAPEAFAPDFESDLKSKTEERFLPQSVDILKGNLLCLLKVKPLSSLWLRSKFLSDLSVHVIWALRLHISFDRFKAYHWWFSMTP